MRVFYLGITGVGVIFLLLTLIYYVAPTHRFGCCQTGFESFFLSLFGSRNGFCTLVECVASSRTLYLDTLLIGLILTGVGVYKIKQVSKKV